MDAKTAIPPPPKDEFWVRGSRLQIVQEMLVAIGDDFDLEVWLNGKKIRSSTVAETGGEADSPKAT